jgi:hypothetical protein
MFAAIQADNPEAFIRALTVKRRTVCTPIRPGGFHTVQWNDAREKFRKYKLQYELSHHQMRDEHECLLFYKVRV